MSEFVSSETLPNDYEECSKCGYDHEYDHEEAQNTHHNCPICSSYEDVHEIPDHECYLVCN